LQDNSELEEGELEEGELEEGELEEDDDYDSMPGMVGSDDDDEVALLCFVFFVFSVARMCFCSGQEARPRLLGLRGAQGQDRH
jgi:hypothetical protein